MNIRLRPKNPNWPLLLLGDATVFSISLFIAWFIRSRLDAVLSELLFGFSSIALVLPWLIVIRVLSSFLLDLYSVRLGRLRVVDISRLFIVYLIPTVIFALFRVLSPIELLRLPFSIIFMEYVFSVFGSVVIRLLYIDIQYRIASNHSPHIRHAILYGDINEISTDLIKRFERHIILHGIISPNPMQWEQVHFGITVLGNSAAVYSAMKYDNSISSIIIIGHSDLTEKRRQELLDIASRLSLDVYDMNEDVLELIHSGVRAAMSAPKQGI
jgi:hypothetical protein